MKLETAYDASWHPERYSAQQIADAMAKLNYSIKVTKPHTRRGKNARYAYGRLMQYRNYLGENFQLIK